MLMLLCIKCANKSYHTFTVSTCIENYKEYSNQTTHARKNTNTHKYGHTHTHCVYRDAM